MTKYYRLSSFPLMLYYFLLCVFLGACYLWLNASRILHIAYGTGSIVSALLVIFILLHIVSGGNE